MIEQPGIGSRVRARRPTDGRLVDVDDLVELFDSVDAIVLAGPHGYAVDQVREAAKDDVVDKRRLARSRNACHADQ